MQHQQTKVDIQQLIERETWDDIHTPTGDLCLDIAIQLKLKLLATPILEGDYDLAFRRAIVGNVRLIIQPLLAKITNINGFSLAKRGQSALHFAAANGAVDLVELLLTHGAFVNHLDKDCNSPLHLACQNNHLNVALLLQRHGAYGIVNKQGESPITIISRNGKMNEFGPYVHIEMLKLREKASRPALSSSTHAWIAQPEIKGYAIMRLFYDSKPAVSYVHALKNVTNSKEVHCHALEDTEHNSKITEKLKELLSNNKIKVLKLDDLRRLENEYSDCLAGEITHLLIAGPGSFAVNVPREKAASFFELADKCVILEELLGSNFKVVFTDKTLDKYFVKSDLPLADLSIASDLYGRSSSGEIMIQGGKLDLVLGALRPRVEM